MDGTGKIIYGVFGHAGADGFQCVLDQTELSRGMLGDAHFSDSHFPDGFIVVGDSGFTLRVWLMAPFKKCDFFGIPLALSRRRRTYNLRLSKCESSARMLLLD